MEITEATLPSKLVFKLDFFEPFEGHNTAEFTLEPKGGGTEVGTEVTWLMHGPANFLSKIMCTLLDMDKMVGGDFAAGLANLKTISEK